MYTKLLDCFCFFGPQSNNKFPKGVIFVPCSCSWFIEFKEWNFDQDIERSHIFFLCLWLIIYFCFRKDTSPIVASCTCYTCLNHTKAYINHLLNVHEMLAQTLLEMYENLLHSLIMTKFDNNKVHTLRFLDVADIILTITLGSSDQ